MTTLKFSVTYGIVSPESAENGDYAESGYIIQDVSFREALHEFGDIGPIEADCCPITRDCPPRWLTAIQESPDMRTGEYEHRSLHFPDSLTPSTRIRIARLLGCYGLK